MSNIIEMNEMTKPVLRNALVLTKERKEGITKKDSILRATHGSSDKPLVIGDIQIPCYVLSNGVRVFVQTGMAGAIGLSNKGGGKITTFVHGKSIGEFIKPELLTALNNPIKFRTPKGMIAHGYEATVLIDVCEAVLEAKNRGKLLRTQEHIGVLCEIIIKGSSRLGVVGLIDEITGYQKIRPDDALQQILGKFIADKIHPWTKTFPDPFFIELCRLRNIPYPMDTNHKYMGHLVNNIVYKRLAPGLLPELKDVTPKSKNGNKTAKYFQSLTTNIGHPLLKEHLAAVLTLMKVSDTYEDFISKLNKTHPVYILN